MPPGLNPPRRHPVKIILILKDSLDFLKLNWVKFLKEKFKMSSKCQARQQGKHHPFILSDVLVKFDFKMIFSALVLYDWRGRGPEGFLWQEINQKIWSTPAACADFLPCFLL